MRVDDFDFDLPDAAIALRPAIPRDAARLLAVARDGSLTDGAVGDLAAHLRAGDALLVNATRVVPARLTGVSGDRKLDLTLIAQENATDWRGFARGRWRAGDVVEFDDVRATILAREGREVALRFEVADMPATLARIGAMPLPPYIASKRAPDARDDADYQTMFARVAGAVAAPTAGLHFTPELVARLEGQGVELHEVILHVGPGTFLPVVAEDTDDHRMHGEHGTLTAETAEALNAARKAGGRIVCVGTTTLRLLEAAAQADGTIAPFDGETDIFITPGYRFRAADMLLTNFHLPRSTLFMLVAAFSGLAEMKRAYAHAIEAGYRFYSYGDACLLEGRAA